MEGLRARRVPTASDSTATLMRPESIADTSASGFSAGDVSNAAGSVAQGDVLGMLLARDKRPLPSPTPEEVQAKMGRAFFVQLNITHSGIALGVSAYTGLLDSMAEAGKFPQFLASIVWYIAVAIAITIFSLQIVRALRYPHLLKRDFTSNKLTSFFASPAIVTGTLALSLPRELPQSWHTGLGMRIVFYALFFYQTGLALYWYGDWLFRTGYSLRSVHATFFMATTEFFILGALGALVERDNVARLSLYVGILFWILVFVAVFAFLSKTLEESGEKATPTMFLFIAPPATAAIAHMDLQQNIGGKRMDDFTWFFVSVTFFIYLLLMRVFRQYWTRRFSITWWAYIFPLSTAANLATIIARELNEPIPWAIAFIATGIATIMIVVVILITSRQVARGNVPRDDTAIRAHYQRLMDREWAAKQQALAVNDPEGPLPVDVESGEPVTTI